MPEHGYTISSPCEPNGSGELKTHVSSNPTNSTIWSLLKMTLGHLRTYLLFKAIFDDIFAFPN